MPKKITFLDARNTAQDLAQALKSAWSITSAYEQSLKTGDFDNETSEANRRRSAIASVKRMQALQDKLNKQIAEAIAGLSDYLQEKIV